MSKAIVDLEEMRRFITSFGFLCGNLREQKDRINREFRELNEVWRDSRYTKFDASFKETAAEIDKFLRYAEVYAEYLQRKASAIKTYLGG